MKDMKDHKQEMHSDTLFAAKRMSNGKWVTGQVIGTEPFIYILTQENYDKAIFTEENSRSTCDVQMRLIRVIGHSVRKIDRFPRISLPNDKNNVLFGVGDIVYGKCKDGFTFDGRIFHIDIQKNGDKLDPIMFVSQLPDSRVEKFGHSDILISDIDELEVLRFKEEETPTLP